MLTDTVSNSRAFQPHTAPGFLQRAMDVICCIALLPLLGLTTLWLALIVLLFSPGPIFYRQACTTPSGRSFHILRLRTKHVARPRSGNRPATPTFPSSDESRRSVRSAFLPTGRLISATGLSELPRIFSILSGETSLFGARLHAGHTTPGRSSVTVHERSTSPADGIVPRRNDSSSSTDLSHATR